MSLVEQKAGDSHVIYTFAKALEQLACCDGQLTPPLETFLTSNAAKLSACPQPFKSPQSASRSKIDTGKFTASSGQSVTLGEREKDVVKQLADKLQVDEVEAAVHLKGYRRSKGENINVDVEASLCKSDDFWQGITAFVLEEQLRVIQLVALLLRSADFEVRVPAEVVQRFTTEVTTPQFAQALLDRVLYLATTPIPTSAIPDSPLWAKFWVQQQKALLEVYFLLYYNRLFPNGKSLLKVLQFTKETVWGSYQVNEGLFDAEALALAQDVGALCHLILIENMNLERAASPEAEEFKLLPSQIPAQDEVLHPQTLQDIHQNILDLISLHPRQSSLLALAWAALLFRITESISSVPLAETYYDIAQQILSLDLQPRKDNPSPQANASDQAFWQQLATHALSPHVACITFLCDLLRTPLISSNNASDSPGVSAVDPNVAGYLSVLRSVLASLSRLVHPTYLPPQDFDSLVTVFETMYSNPEASLLRGNFWGLFAESEGSNSIREEEWQIFEVAAKRFPAEAGPLTRMLLAVSGGRSSELMEIVSSPNLDEEDSLHIAVRCADHTVRYLARPHTFTQTMPTVSLLMPLPYAPSKASNAGPTDIVATRPIEISPSLILPPGTAGRIVSLFDQRPLIVSWSIASLSDASFSILRFYGDQFLAFATRISGKKLGTGTSVASDDPFETPGNGGLPESFTRSLEEQLPDITSAIALLRNVLQRLPGKNDQILQATFGDVRVGIRTLFAIFERTAHMEGAATLFVATANILTVLLVTHSEEVWVLFRSSDVVFPLEKSSIVPIWGSRANSTSKSILGQDKILGEYQRTLACLEVVHGLLLQAQWTVALDSSGISELKSNVLKRAIRWSLTSILTSYNSWKYRNLRQKFELGTRLAAIFGDLLQEKYSQAQGSLGEAVAVVWQALLVHSGHAQLAALMSIISTGNSVLGNLQRLGKTTDCSIVESCIYKHLQLINRLLQLSRRVVTNGPTMLERLLFAHATDNVLRSILPNASQGPIYMLIEYLVHCNTASIATEAAGILTKLCRLSVDWGPPSERPSFLSHLGSIRDTEAILHRLVELAGDPFGDLDLQLSTWRLLSAILASQPGFSSLLVTGRQALEPFDDSAALDEEGSTAALTLALDVVHGWEEAWRVQPAILSAAFTFLLEVWQNYAESSKRLLQVRKDEKIWTSVLSVLESSTTLQQDKSSTNMETHVYVDVEQAYRRHAQAAAAALYAAELQYSHDSPSLVSSPPHEQISANVFRKFLGSPARLLKCCKNAVQSSVDETRIRQIQSQITEVFAGLDLDTFIRPRLVDCDPYGPNFYYDTNILAKRLVGYAQLAPSSSATIDDVLSNIRHANTLWSIADAEVASLNATSSWLMAGLVDSKSDTESIKSLRSTCQSLLQSYRIGQEATAIAEAHHNGSLQLVLTMMEHLSRHDVEPPLEIVNNLLPCLGPILTNDAFALASSLQNASHQYPKKLFKLAYHTFHLIAKPSKPVTVSRTAADARSYEAAEVCLLSCLRACNSLILAAKDFHAADQIGEDLAWASAAVSEILSSTICPPSAAWLACCIDEEFFRHSLDYLSSVPLDSKTVAIARAILDLFLAMAGDAHTAERMALEGMVYSICNNAMTVELEAGTVRAAAVMSEKREEGPSRHKIWILYLSIVTQLVCHLGSSISFMDQEVSTFLQMYRAQLQRSLHWSTNEPLPLPELREMRAVLTLLSTCVKSAAGTAQMQVQVQQLLQTSLRTLPQLVYLLQHPNLLVSLIEPATLDENTWLLSDSGGLDAVDLGDFHDHPVVASLCQEIFSLCWLIVSTIIAHTESFGILTRDRVDWPKDRVVIAASANVSLDEPATCGTLFDLARFCTDVTRHCSPAPLKASGNSPIPRYDSTMMRETAEQCFEGTLLLMSTQIALTVQQQDLAGADDRASQRARRDLKELASDLLEEFLDKASGQQQPQERKLPELLKSFVLRL